MITEKQKKKVEEVVANIKNLCKENNLNVLIAVTADSTAGLAGITEQYLGFGLMGNMKPLTRALASTMIESPELTCLLKRAFALKREISGEAGNEDIEPSMN